VDQEIDKALGPRWPASTDLAALKAKLAVAQPGARLGLFLLLHLFPIPMNRTAIFISRGTRRRQAATVQMSPAHATKLGPDPAPQGVTAAARDGVDANCP
jgi:hypothetical protein